MSIATALQFKSPFVLAKLSSRPFRHGEHAIERGSHLKILLVDHVTGIAGVGFPTTPGVVQTTFNGGSAPFGDGFVTKLGPSGQLVFSTYIGDFNDDGGDAIAVDAAGRSVDPRAARLR